MQKNWCFEILNFIWLSNNDMYKSIENTDYIDVRSQNATNSNQHDTRHINVSPNQKPKHIDPNIDLRKYNTTQGKNIFLNKKDQTYMLNVHRLLSHYIQSPRCLEIIILIVK